MKVKKIAALAAAILCPSLLFSVDIETALQKTAEEFSSSMKKNTTIAIVGIASESQDLSDFMLDDLTLRFVQTKKVTVANRANLDAIKTEMNFQLSGEVSNDSIQQLGAMAGANVVIHGRFIPLGRKYSLTIQALNVSSAEVINICRYDIEENETLELLLGSSHTERKIKNKKWSNDLQIGIGASAAADGAKGFFIGVTNYNLYNFNNVFSLGFAESLCGSIGESGGGGIYAIDFILGPAIGVNIKNIVKLQFSPGLDLGDWGTSGYSDARGKTPAHFSLDFCFKFIPNKVVSPLLGIRMKFSSYSYERTEKDYRGIESYVREDVTDLASISTIFGMSFNFGKR